MEGSLKELAGYRLERAKEMRSANALKGFDSSKHSGVIAVRQHIAGSANRTLILLQMGGNFDFTHSYDGESRCGGR